MSGIAPTGSGVFVVGRQVVLAGIPTGQTHYTLEVHDGSGGVTYYDGVYNGNLTSPGFGDLAARVQTTNDGSELNQNEITGYEKVGEYANFSFAAAQDFINTFNTNAGDGNGVTYTAEPPAGSPTDAYGNPEANSTGFQETFSSLLGYDSVTDYIQSSYSGNHPGADDPVDPSAFTECKVPNAFQPTPPVGSPGATLDTDVDTNDLSEDTDGVVVDDSNGDDGVGFGVFQDVGGSDSTDADSLDAGYFSGGGFNPILGGRGPSGGGVD